MDEYILNLISYTMGVFIIIILLKKCKDRYRRRLIIPPSNIIQISIESYEKEIKDTLESYGIYIIPFDQECSICLENINANTPIYNLDCKHYFHKNCLQLAIKENLLCPLCRAQIRKK